MQVPRKARSSISFSCLSWLIRDLAFTVRDSRSSGDAGVSHGGLYGDIHDEWGILPHHFEIIPPASEKVTRGGGLKQTRSMPFPTRQGPDEFAAEVPPSRPPPTFRHTRKNSKIAQLLCIASAPENAGDAVNPGDPHELMSPPILPMEADPFSGRPLGATIIGNGVPVPAIQMQTTHPPAPQHIFRPMLSMPSLSMPADPHATHAHVPRVHAPQNINDFHDTAARRAPRPRHRADHAPVGTFSSRSLSNPPPASSVLGHYTSPSQPLQPSRVVNLESNSRRHGSIPIHMTHQGGAVAPLVATHRRHRQKTYDHVRTGAPNLRKTRSSVVLSNKPLPPLHAPKPVKALERPSVETLHMLVESARATARHSNVRNEAAAAHAVWPPAPVVRPLPTVNPERDAYRTAAIEAEKTSRKISQERALVDRVRHEGGREARRRERDSEPQRSRHHKRAATEGPKRRKREVEYRTLADYGYNPTDQKWMGAW
ncbi:hypothetical protein DFH94DRAFT_729182 [Russula ochroleuca]|jgi:hypothetical protein|uniref:Uncharacterized protein n=1 Tax=Russula ochroleuca TaxID=152965 RepID=A0A9P5MZM2_9AGAM|nr:hypothetical protein DFH94DRAFT_729182 [Russula ochroleuca]